MADARSVMDSGRVSIKRLPPKARTPEAVRRGPGLLSEPRRRKLTEILTYVVLVLGCVFALAPILWGLSTSLKVQSQIAAYPPVWWPSPFTLEHYTGLLIGPEIKRFFLNSALLAISTIVICLLVATPAAYAAARFKFRGKTSILLLLLASSMIPGISILIPIYTIAVQANLLNGYFVLIVVYTAWMIPQAVWFIRGFLDGIPAELEEAAMIDGCSRFGAFMRVVLPLMRPGLAATSMLIFMFVWNDFLIGAMLTTQEEMRTVQVGLVRYIQEPTGVWWGQFMAFAMLAIAPVVIAFLFLQRRFVEGLTAGGVKG